MKPAWLVVVVLAACGSDGGSTPGSDGPSGVDAAPDSSGPAIRCDPAQGWRPLIQRSWSLDPGQETYRCTRIQVPADQYITGYCSKAPQGTHHTVLTISDTATTTGDYDCTAGTLDNKMLFAAGLQTDDLLFPTGVAIKLGSAQYINLNLHLFNLTDQPLSGESGVYIKTVPASEVVHEADMVFSGTFNITVPPDSAQHDMIGGCAAPADWHVFGVWPHMHQIATHQKLEVTPIAGGPPLMLLDDAYDFNEQKNYPMAETLVHQGDQIRTTCSYLNDPVANPPTRTVHWGDSSTQEMCFTGMYKWPASTNCPAQGCLFECTSY